MIIKEDIRYFLKHGNFEHVPFGLSKSELLEMLGETKNFRYTAPTDTFPSVYCYGRIEFHFHKYKKSTFRGATFEPERPEVDKMNWDFNAFRWAMGMTRKKAITFLRNNGIRFIDKKYSHERKAWELETEGGVRLFFVNEESPDTYLLKRFERFVD